MSDMTAAYGSWKSPITSELIVGESIGLSQPVVDGGDVYWIEMRPNEGGRNVLVRQDGATLLDLTLPALNARTKVHEYGGGDYAVRDGVVCFSNFSDQRLYVQTAFSNAPANPITPAGPMRYADAWIDGPRKQVICVREDHSVAEREAVNTLVTLRLEGNDDFGQVLVSGNDFYSSPRVSPDGSQLAWLTWNHPNMPWDGTELWIANLNGSRVEDPKRIAGGSDESIVQPEWSPDGLLYFVSDRSGWWNLYRKDVDETIEPVYEMEAEFGMPQWGFGMSSYGFVSADQIICAYIDKGISRLATIDTHKKLLEQITSSYTDIRFIRAGSGQAVMRAASPTEAAAIVTFDPRTKEFSILRKSNNLQIDTAYLSEPRTVEFPTEGGLTAHAFLYLPKNGQYCASVDELPPLLVESHGGPTAAATPALSLGIQYWTSRGIAVLDVNYGGSSGFGRAYRRRLNGNWGVVDVDDCCNGARYLIGEGLVDGNRVMISGGSAGGYTTLCALTFRDTFKAGASHYGVSDVEALAKDTHKFESRYLDSMIGPYPEMRGIYFERSPVNFTDRLACPVIFFQGLEDKVVPPNQAEAMVSALSAKGIPVAFLPFAGEQHGFRQAKNIKRALDAELYFYSRVFGFELAEPVEPVEIKNL